ncbi:MAG: glycoside-pentoside-hexuronide (GPH):cation symporter [bacterium]|nr:glycoside-pentoside-hexuronide (GPH):cation symporter [bacterium]
MTQTKHNTKAAIPPFGLRDKAGYLFGDFGNDFTFILSSSFMLKFYTDVMGISGSVVGLLMMAARFLDAFTDVTMGQIVDRSKPTAYGKFRPWIRRMCGPVAISSFLIYQSAFASFPYAFKVFWMVVTYLLWGSIFYTSINIPYGSMASAISSDPKDRAELSTWRSAGATLAGLVIGVGTPIFAYETVNGNTVLSGPRMTILAGIFSLFAILCYLLCFSLVQERVEVPKNTQKLSLVHLFTNVFGNRALLGIIAAAICLLLAMLTMTGMSAYVFPNYYGSASAQSLSSFLTSAATLAICAPLAVRMSLRFGKKEFCAVMCFFASIVFFLCLLVHPKSPYGYILFFTAAYIGVGFFNTIIWAMITDVIDDAEVRNGIREDGTIYSVYSFARKLGQALSSGLVGVLLDVIGYSQSTAFEPQVVESLFSLSCIAPAIGFLLTALSLHFLYPLDKKQVESNTAILAERRNS